MAPSLVFQEADLSVRVVRDIFSADFERAVVDDPGQYQRLVSFFTRTAPELVDRVELWCAPTIDAPAFAAWRARFDAAEAAAGLVVRRARRCSKRGIAGRRKCACKAASILRTRGPRISGLRAR